MINPLLDLKKIYSERRAQLLKTIKDQYKTAGSIVLFANFEREQELFVQESSFYYLTGVNEPGAVLVISLDGKTTLYVPNTNSTRQQWIEGALDTSPESVADAYVDEIKYLGDPIKGYELAPFFLESDYKDLIALLRDQEAVFTLSPDTPTGYVEQRNLLQRLYGFVPSLEKSVQNISAIVTDMRSKKSNEEIDLLHAAIDITIMGHESAARMISSNRSESEVHASVEYVFTASQAQLAFPSIVGSGKNSTVLHYTANNQPLEKDSLVVVDCGARFYHYCADITRTYPVSGKFTARQREIYQLVLDCQEYIADIAKPGMWLNNKDKPKESLNHLAREFFKKHDMDQYFVHGIGHYLGLDTHDVGDYTKPLEEGNVITIEPGLYLAHENIGVRIEDNYWIVKTGAVCLSEALPKTPDAIEGLAKEAF
ncbi:MAG TPA: Xaa-Pro peptidase family protein [Candidatus Babeliales bacterium]|nr:Xaa-Pro peptidase family protein [Candidatus Babeliales bacterium]